MDDKFILMGLNDDKAGHIAEVLKNKTCKRVLDYLADVKEASEKDIADALSIPINTVEYNLKKLVKSGLVEKTKNFFWSVKGKKIPMYKLARKHIIISPNKKPNINYIKSILPVIILAVFAIFLVSLFMHPGQGDIEDFDQTKLRQFNSQTELDDFIEKNSETGSIFGGWFGGVMRSADTSFAVAESAEAGASKSADEYSTTNIQVQGVDEADIVKNDGKYIYVVSNNKVLILDAYPAEDMGVLSEIELEGVREIYLNDDKLIVFVNSYGYGVYEKEVGIAVDEGYAYSNSRNLVYIYDISDRENPELENEFEIEGNYVNSRMIGEHVYVISTKYVNVRNSEPPVYAVNGIETKVAASDVYYWNYPDTNYVFTSISAIDVDNGDFSNEVYLISGSSNIYVSQNNIYLTSQKRFDYENYAEDIAEQVYFPILPNMYNGEIQEVLDSDEQVYDKLNKMQIIIDYYSNSLKGNEKAEFDEGLYNGLMEFEINMQKQMEKTIVHKINIDEQDIEYIGFGEAPGRVLNQFSMDEYDGYFRIATTTGNFGRSGDSLNHIYILDSDLEIVGSVEDLAKGEQIYSARFMGNRVYLVTFRNIDPLFVIDLENPKKPEVLGYLKITGYSNYLHPYDENHIIGIGKETAGGSEDFSWYQGVKVSLFDVSDVENPIEVDKFEIGDRGTNSDALYEHKAVLFDKEKGILVLPISLYEIDESKYSGEVPDNAYGEFVWQGAYVLNIDLDGISLRGTLSHDSVVVESGNGDEPVYDLREDYRNYPDWRKAIKRSLYMDDVLYTISNVAVKASDLISVDELNVVEIF